MNRLYDLLDEGLVVLDNSGVIVHSNQAFADSLQYSAGELLNRRFNDLVVEEQRGILSSHLIPDSGQSISLTLEDCDGERQGKIVRIIGLIEEELPKGFFLIITDEQCAKFEKIVSSAYLKMVTIDTDLNITYVNPAFDESAEEIIGTPVVLGVGPEYRDEFRHKLETAIRSGTKQEIEISETPEGKSTTWHILRIGPIRDEAEVIGAVIAGYEITDRVKAMQALQESERKFRGVFEHASDAITLADEEGTVVAINAAQENLFGLNRESVIGAPIWTVQASLLSESAKTLEYQKYLQDSLHSFFAKGTAPWLEKKTEGEFIHPLDGSHKSFEQRAFKIPTSKGFMLCSFVSDTTEQARMEEARRISENRYRALFEENIDGVFIIDLAGKFMEVNSKGVEILGYDDPTELVGQPFTTAIADSEKTESIRRFEEMMRGDIRDIYERTVVRRDGSEIRVELSVSLVKDEEGNPLHVQSIMRDVTERVKVQEALNESRERYELALKGADLGVWDWNADADEMIFSDRWAEILGYTVDEIEPNYAGWEKLIHPEDIESMEERWNEHVYEKTPFYSSEHRMRTKAGGWKWVLERGKVVERNEEGGTKRATGTLLDITERKVIEKALIQSEEKYRNLLENIPQKVYYKNRDSIYIAVNPAFAADLGLTPSDIMGKTDYDIYPKELADGYRASDRQVLETLETFEIDESYILDGETRIAHTVKVPVRDDEGNIVGILGIFWDITKRIEAETKVLRDRQIFREIAKAAIQSKDTKELSLEIMTAITTTLGYDFGIFRQYDEKRNSLRKAAVLAPKELLDIDEIPVTEESAKEFLLARSALDKKPIIITNINEASEDITYLEHLKNLGAVSVAAFPILDEVEELLGILSVSTKTLREHTESDLELFSTISNMLSTVLERRKAEQALQISELRYRELVTDISEGIGIMNLDEQLLFVNDSFAEILGYSAEELVGMSILDIVDPSDRENILKQTELRREGNTSTYKNRFIRRDGEKRTVRVSAVPSRDDTGEVDGTIAIVTDITEQEKAEEALKESELKFRRVFESMPVAMHLLVGHEKDDFLLIDANPAADKLFRVDHTEYIGKTVSEMPLIHGANEIPTRFKEVLETGESWAVDEIAYDGDEIQMALQVQVFRTTKDTLVSSFLDITERIVKDREIKRLNEGLTRMVDERTAELAAANKELEAFAYSVSHDLRAPLRTIDGFSQALMEDYSDSIDDTGKDFLNRVRAAAKHMGSLIEDLLVLSRVTRADMDRIEVDLSQIAIEVIKELQDIDEDRAVDIKIADFAQARCDRRLIKLVLQNLFDNAWKFTRKTPNAEIEFGTKEQDGETLFYVKDNGAGFDMEYEDRLFIPFQRLHQVEDFEGSGIGLATVQRIINRHGGRVWAEGEVGEGSTFFFTIPESRSIE
jgi:PAS domain S-box-containing protein